MKKSMLSLFLLTVFTFVGTLFAEDSACCMSVSSWRLDGNIGYFYPSSKQLRKVISNGVDYQLMLTYRFSPSLGVFFGVDYFSEQGRSTGTHSKTKLTLVPLTLGLKATTVLSTFCNSSHVLQGYFLVGPRWYFARATNCVDYLSHHNYAQGAGGVIGFGLEYLVNCLSINGFVNYSQAHIHVNSSRNNVKKPDVDVGGFVIGGGVGFNF